MTSRVFDIKNTWKARATKPSFQNREAIFDSFQHSDAHITLSRTTAVFTFSLVLVGRRMRHCNCKLVLWALCPFLAEIMQLKTGNTPAQKEKKHTQSRVSDVPQTQWQIWNLDAENARGVFVYLDRAQTEQKLNPDNDRGIYFTWCGRNISWKLRKDNPA